jgi:hypothetical protein
MAGWGRPCGSRAARHCVEPVQPKRHRRRRFPTRYTRADVGLPAIPDAVHETLSGPSTILASRATPGWRNSRRPTRTGCGQAESTANAGSVIIPLVRRAAAIGERRARRSRLLDRRIQRFDLPVQFVELRFQLLVR